jgi:hypothetical protein
MPVCLSFLIFGNYFINDFGKHPFSEQNNLFGNINLKNDYIGEKTAMSGKFVSRACLEKEVDRCR